MQSMAHHLLVPNVVNRLQIIFANLCRISPSLGMTHFPLINITRINMTEPLPTGEVLPNRQGSYHSQPILMTGPHLLMNR